MKKSLTWSLFIAFVFSSGLYAQAPDSLWSRTFGGGGDERCYSAQQTADGGYILAGQETSFGAGDRNFWLVKTDANGNSLWSRTYQGRGDDPASFVEQTEDGGFILAGYTTRFGESSADFWMVKTNANGDSVWSQAFGAGGNDECKSVHETMDGGYILAGSSDSYGSGYNDFWLVKTDAIGDSLWSRTYGGNDRDACSSMQQTADSGYVLAGYTQSFGAGSYDFWLVKTDVNGDTLWTRTFGGSGHEGCSSVQQTIDDGYIMAGHTDSFGAGGYDFWLVKTDANGDTLWTRTFGGSGYDDCFSVQQTADGGYVMAGFTQSFGSGNSDIWLVKTDVNGDSLWSRTFGGANREDCYTVLQALDGGYMMAGLTQSFGAGGRDMWLVKTSPDVVPGTISGTVSGGFSGIDVQLLDNSSQLLTTVQTLEDGTYLFDTLDAGTYYVELVVPAGYAVDQNTVEVVLNVNEDAVVNFLLTSLEGSIHGSVVPTYAGIIVDLYGVDDSLLVSTLTDSGGFYIFSQLSPDTYYVNLVEPIGFEADTNHIEVDLQAGQIVFVDFELIPIVTCNQARSRSFWKHQVKFAIRGWGCARYTAGELQVFAQDIYNSFYLNPINPIQIEDATFVGDPAEPLTLQDMNRSLRNRRCGGSMYQRARAQYLALLLNVVSGRLAQYADASEDGASVSQAIVHINNILDSNPQQAKAIARRINLGRIVAAGLIPLSTPDILFADASNFEAPQPNPFNPTTTLTFQLMQAKNVKLVVYDVLGRTVATLADGYFRPGEYKVIFDGTRLASGMYFAHFQAGEYNKVHKLMLLK